MKKKFYFATLVIAALSFTGCANDEYVGDQQKLGEQNGAIAFSTKSTNTVRANLTNGAAAEKLHNQFWVYGWKEKISTGEEGTITESALVFNNYKVVYYDGTTPPSNTIGWKYVGISIPGTDPSQTQTIKYWDYSYDQYAFEAYSYSDPVNGSVKRINSSKDEAGNSWNNGLTLGDYEVVDINETGCSNLYFAEKKTVQKSNDNYKNAVQLRFKSALSKIRVGFYETIPGYSVKINRFYGPANGGNPTAWDEGSTTEFVAWCPNNKIDGTKSFVVNYDSNGNPVVTKVKQSYDDANKYRLISNEDNDYTLNQKLTLGSNLKKDKVIGDSYSKVTWDRLVVNTTNPDYTYVIPQNDEGLWSGVDGKVQPMKIKVDYTLTSTDGSGEVINVTGATAIVPAEYLKWKPNTAYSYVFKISDNTNGSTGGEGGTEGLYPIIFDAVVEDMAEYKDHLTTVSELSITATQGKQFAEADKAVFKTGEAINVKVMYNSNDITSNVGSQTGSNKFEVAFVENTDYDYNKSPEHNLPNGTSLVPINQNSPVITLDGQTNAGFWIVKVTYKDGEKIITKYAVLKVETVPTPPSQEGGKG